MFDDDENMFDEPPAAFDEPPRAADPPSGGVKTAVPLGEDGPHKLTPHMLPFRPQHLRSTTSQP